MSEKSQARQRSPLTSSAGASPAKTSASPEKARGFMGSAAGSGGSSTESFASFDPDSLSWRTSQLSVLGDSPEFSGRWPRSGTMLGGIAYPLKPSAPLTAVTGSSWSRGEYPTPTAVRYGMNRGGGAGANTGPVRESLDTWARQWATPTVSAATGGQRSRGGKRKSELLLGGQAIKATNWPTPRATAGTSLTDATVRDGRHDLTTCTHGGDCRPALSPRFVEWLMGFPIGHTDLGHLETRSFRKSRK